MDKKQAGQQGQDGPTGDQSAIPENILVTQENKAAKNIIGQNIPDTSNNTVYEEIGKLLINNVEDELQTDVTHPLVTTNPVDNAQSTTKKIKIPSFGLNLSLRKYFILVSAISLTLMFVVFSAFMYLRPTTQSNILDNKITIAGIDVSKQNTATALEMLKKVASAQKITLVINDKTLEGSAADIGINRDLDSAVNEAKHLQRPFIEKIGLKSKTGKNIEIKSTVDKNKLNAFIGSKIGEDLLAKDAQLVLNGEEFEVKSGQKGLSINTDDLMSNLNVTSLNSNPKINAKTEQVEPNITDSVAEQAKSQALALINATYTVGHPSVGNKLLGMNLKSKWVVIAPDNNNKTINVSINKQTADKDFTWLTKTFNRASQNKVKVNIPGQAVITLDEGADGIDMSDEEINKAKAEFLNKLDQKQPYEAVISPSLQARGEKVYDGQQKMVMANLTSLRAYAVENGQILRTAPVTAGKAGHETPTGTFSILRKITQSTMSGCAYGECWSVPNLKWQSYFTSNGDAIHATPAPNAVGRYNISHGCLGMYEADAKWFFDWAVVGTPVVIVR